MSSLNKLAIRGIRSFDDKQISVIEFFTPVTVIVGHNGSGKTTIIECLKYATTGEQPPNTRGGAFVHDPKMANEKEVKAQVKLRFHSANGTRMLAVRNLSVTVKKTSGLTMKTLESILGLDEPEKTGKRAVISTKCAEMDVEIPQLLGVSKAVLENVIFCHQEDSYWPLAEPSILKKKFDEIFEATKYTKALDSIKSLRKDRVAELKAEQERLSSLKLQKDRADKLRLRMKESTANIAAKEVDCENRKNEYEQTVEDNRKFYEYGTKFREIYLKVENLEEKKKSKQRDLDEARDGNFQEITGSDDELQNRLNRFEMHLDSQKQRLIKEERTRQDFEDELANHREEELKLSGMKAHLEAEAQAQAARLSEREQLVHEIGKQFGISVSRTQSPLDKVQVNNFLTRINDVKRKRAEDIEKLQSDVSNKMEEYNTKLRKLDYESQTHKIQKNTLRDQLNERHSSIKQAQRQLEDEPALQAGLNSLQEEIEEKQARIEKLKREISASQHDKRLQEKVDVARQLEEKREALMEETRALSTQADSRAKLDLKRAEIKTKTYEVQTMLRAANVKFEEIAGRGLTADTADTEVDRVLRQKEEEKDELERDANQTNLALHTMESEIANLKAQLSKKIKEHEGLDNQVKGVLDDGQTSLDVAISLATEELEIRRKDRLKQYGTAEVYEKILVAGKDNHVCLGCNRSLDDDELDDFEQYLVGMIKKSSKDKKTAEGDDVEAWEGEVKTLQTMKPAEVTRNQLAHVEIPALQAQLAEREGARPEFGAKAETLADQLNAVKDTVKALSALKQQVVAITRLRKEIEKAEKDVGDLKTDLSLSGSTKTVDDVQLELNDITGQLRTIEKERQGISTERERQTTALHTYESRLHDLKLEEQKMSNQINEVNKLSERVEQMRKDITAFNTQLKELEVKIAEAQAPIQALEDEQKQVQQDLNARTSQAQTLLGQLNARADKLAAVHKDVERYARDKRDRALDDCTAKIQQSKEDQTEASGKIQACREAIKAIEKEINEAGASQTNLRENIRVRKLQREILEIQTQIETYDVEEAAKARRNFQAQWEQKKAAEEALNKASHTLRGELVALKSALTTLENDLKEFKDINKNYTNQLVKVKISDMANSDLEKYAQALDNAIMKYHGLKMEEVNDTMKHLWNKTYQGTDIDGIKIRSDVEGGASRRSYNYRVVMTKDQVEMDMRGRCSAGQKMLASIIIRLALSDSFGQNCGILALDEPTNALDTENIDALAESLVDIINERKSHSNFQLIIITHDENFLRKLGQNDVMEHYWRISRDARQKSVIERQRFR